jgi:hypothetical protein
MLKIADEIPGEAEKSVSQLENAFGLQVKCSSLAAQQASTVVEPSRSGELPEWRNAQPSLFVVDGHYCISRYGVNEFIVNVTNRLRETNTKIPS